MYCLYRHSSFRCYSLSFLLVLQGFSKMWSNFSVFGDAFNFRVSVCRKLTEVSTKFSIKFDKLHNIWNVDNFPKLLQWYLTLACRWLKFSNMPYMEFCMFCNFFLSVSYAFLQLCFHGILSIFTDFPAFVIVEMLSCIEMNLNRQLHYTNGSSGGFFSKWRKFVEKYLLLFQIFMFSTSAVTYVTRLALWFP